MSGPGAATVWLNGELVGAPDARLSPFDHGLLVGDGVFETLVAYEGEPFAWTRHYERLVHSASALGFEPPPSDALLEASRQVLTANGLSSLTGRVRITVTSGPGPLGSDRGDAPPTAVVAAVEQQPYDPTTDVVMSPWPRNERGALAGLKTTSYAENARALADAKARGAGEAIFVNTRGELCEGTATNVYVVDDGGVVRTPPLDSGCLNGVTRQLILLVAERVGVDLREEPLAGSALAEADEAFLSSSPRGAQPIARVDGRALARVPGAVTERLAAAYADLVAAEIDP